jgi:hypothetical protein
MDPTLQAAIDDKRLSLEALNKTIK